MKDPNAIYCHLCQKEVRKRWEPGGNCHNECYWNYVHAAFHPLEDHGNSLNSPPGFSADKELGSFPPASAT